MGKKICMLPASVARTEAVILGLLEVVWVDCRA